MFSRALIFLALVGVLAVPFALRKGQPGRERPEDTVVIITPHNEAIRQEFSRGFAEWYRTKTGRSVRIDWRIVGGTSDISRFLESAYAAAFETEWSQREHQPWSSVIEAGFQRDRLPVDAREELRRAREAFLSSNVSSGIDVFFGGDAYQYAKEADAGRLVDSGLERIHPEWFTDDVIPETYGGETFRDPHGRWIGVVLSSYGILFNRDSYTRLGIPAEPKRWADLTNPQLVGELGLADPTKSGSVCEAFENIIQQQMQRRRAGSSAGRAMDAEAVRAGWADGLRLIQAMGANARYFTDSSQKPPIDVANGDCAAGLCIDFYGRQQEEAIRSRGDARRIGYVSPIGGSAVSTDPIGLLRGAPHPVAAAAFIEYTLSLEGQKLWAFKAGEPGGPTRYALRRMPIRRDFYRHTEWKPLRSDPADAPYDQPEPFVYHPEWTGDLFREIGFVTRVMCLDTQAELVRAWRAILAAPEPRHSRALAVMQEIGPVSYDRTHDDIHARLNARDRVEELRLATELAAYFRSNYARAESIARGGDPAK